MDQAGKPDYAGLVCRLAHLENDVFTAHSVGSLKGPMAMKYRKDPFKPGEESHFL